MKVASGVILLFVTLGIGAWFGIMWDLDSTLYQDG